MLLPLFAMPKPRARSKLAVPTEPVHQLVLGFQNYLHFPDPSPLYCLLGALAANMIPGPPVWLMLVGPPGCGKTELLTSLLGIPRIHEGGVIRGPSALLSGTSKKESAKDATGGLLRQIGANGALLLKDFTSILSLPRDPMHEVLAALREVYDGRWTRAIGSEGGRILHWEGRAALFAGCTNAIDRHHQISAELGERWVYYRYQDSDGWGESNRALTSNIIDGRDELKELVRGFFGGLGLDWGMEQGRRDLTEPERARIIRVATFAARARSSVMRDSYSKEILDVPQPESPTRLATVLAQLYLGMEMIGLDAGERMQILWQIGLDSMPQTRRKALERMRRDEEAGKEGSSVEQVAAEMKMSGASARRVLEDLQAHGVVEHLVRVDRHYWRRTKWARELLESITRNGSRPIY